MKVPVAQKNVYTPQGEFIPMGRLLEEYWRRYATNFPKLAKLTNILKFWPTTSTSLEKTFSLIAAQYNKRRNSILCETLANLYNQSRESREFMEALKKTCADLNLD